MLFVSAGWSAYRSMNRPEAAERTGEGGLLRREIHQHRLQTSRTADFCAEKKTVGNGATRPKTDRRNGGTGIRPAYFTGGNPLI